MHRRILVLFLFAAALIVDANAQLYRVHPVQKVQAVQGKELDVELEKLEPSLREQAKAMLEQTDERRRAQLAVGLGRSNPRATFEFLLALLSNDPSARVRYAIIDAIWRYPDPKIRQHLSRVAVSDADVGVSLLALERMRALLAQDARELLVKRMELARRSNDESAIRSLAAEQERWISLVRGTMLPAFLRVPPPVFSAKADSQTVRILAFGDFGTGSKSQGDVAAAMLEQNRRFPIDFAITLGDNFYNAGMASPTDPRWKKLWDELYDPLGIKFYASLGNHDWVLSDSPAAEILYSERSPSWRMPSPYYTFTAGPAQFFALDTNEVSDAQLSWLDGELNKSSAKWKVVYGHHPIYSDGEHGDNPSLAGRLLPLLKNRVDLYLTGHDHILNHVKPENGVEFFVSGGGGAGVYKVKPGPRTLFAQSVNGFTILEIDSNEMRIKFIGADSKQLYAHWLRKPASK
jgi:predicted MPP superfamily phosphohydrolase